MGTRFVLEEGFLHQAAKAPERVFFGHFWIFSRLFEVTVASLEKLSTRIVCQEERRGEWSTKILQGNANSIRWRVWINLYVISSFFVVRFSQLKIREMLSTLHFTNLPAKMFGNSMKGMISPMASKIALLCGNLQSNSYSQVTVVKAFIVPLINKIAAAPRLSLG